MVIDVNAYIGHYPFRKLRYKTAADLIGLMDRYGIDKSCVGSFNAVYYKDCMEGNLELLEEIMPHKERLIPFCVINPEYNGARDDFIKCVNELGFKGLRLFPMQQGYRLSGGDSVAILKLAAELKIPVHIPLLLEDLRGSHPLDVFSPVGADEIIRAALKSPETDFILSNEYLQYYSQEIEPACTNRPGKVYYDICRVDCLNFSSLNELIKNAGIDRVVFGSGAVLQNIPVQFVKLHYLEKTAGAAADEIEKIKSGNVVKLLNL